MLYYWKEGKMFIVKKLMGLVLLLCLCTGTAFAADWQYLGESQDGAASEFIIQLLCKKITMRPWCGKNI